MRKHRWGCRTSNTYRSKYSNAKDRATAVGKSPVENVWMVWAGILSTTRHVKSCGKLGRPLSKAKYIQRPIVNKYREGKVKSTPDGELKVPETVCLQAVRGLCPFTGMPDCVPFVE